MIFSFDVESLLPIEPYDRTHSVLFAFAQAISARLLQWMGDGRQISVNANNQIALADDKIGHSAPPSSSAEKENLVAGDLVSLPSPATSRLSGDHLARVGRLAKVALLSMLLGDSHVGWGRSRVGRFCRLTLAVRSHHNTTLLRVVWCVWVVCVRTQLTRCGTSCICGAHDISAHGDVAIFDEAAQTAAKRVIPHRQLAREI
jgi:hypothetical protein